ncbi:hypothetical protein R1sor_000648 [Riccia sorocarpa]|uniref:Reverse transcriptase domain-containing protein n=1 Tax=Riccia sorocarpa TaxID=122646 RepID=A0ABD3GVE9_9MARC
MLRNGQLKGVQLQGIGLQYCQGYFADDAHFLLKADEQKLRNAQALLQKFGTASGLVVQWAKSKARWISTSLRPTWLQQFNWIWAEEHELTAKHIRPLDQLPLQPWRKLSLWGPKVTGVRSITRSAKAGPFAALKAAGIEDIGHVTLDGQSTIPLRQPAPPQAPFLPPTTRAYDRVRETTPTYSATHQNASQYAVTPPHTPMWGIKLHAKPHRKTASSQKRTLSPP